MPSYRGRDGFAGIATGLAAYYWIVRAVHSRYGWFGVVIATASLVGLVSILSAIESWRRRTTQRRRHLAPCAHGVVGAASEPMKCSGCSEEKRRAQESVAIAVQERAKRVAAERAQAYAAWLAQARLPEFLSSMDPHQFEILVCELFRRLGHDVEATRYTADGGVDGYLRKDGQLALLQCKRVKGSVGEPILRDLFGTMAAEGASSGLVVTTGKVSAQARRWASGRPIRIIELIELREMVRTNFSESEVVPVNFNPVQGFVDENSCPRCGRPLRVVRGRRGRFQGCTGYPVCGYTQRHNGKRPPRRR